MSIGTRETLKPVVKPLKFIIGGTFVLLAALYFGSSSHDLLFHGVFSCPPSMDIGSTCSQLAGSGAQILLITIHLLIFPTAIYLISRFTAIHSQSIWRGFAGALILILVFSVTAAWVAYTQGMIRSSIYGPTMTATAKLLIAGASYAVFPTIWGLLTAADSRFFADTRFLDRVEQIIP